MILGISLETDRVGIAVRENGKIIYENFSQSTRSGVEHLPELLTAALSDVQTKGLNFEVIGIMVGPGPYSGLRGAVAFAQGLAISSQTPIVPLDSLGAFVDEPKTPTSLPPCQLRPSQIAELAEDFHRAGKSIPCEKLRPIYGKPLKLKNYVPKVTPRVS